MNPIQTFLAAKGRFELAAHRLRNDHRPLIDSESLRRSRLLLLQTDWSVDIVLQEHDLQTLSKQLAGTQPSPNPQNNVKWNDALGLMREISKPFEDYTCAARLLFQSGTARNESPTGAITEPSVVEMRAAMQTLRHSIATLDQDLRRVEAAARATAGQVPIPAAKRRVPSGGGSPGTLTSVDNFLAAIEEFESAIEEFEKHHRALLQSEGKVFLIRRRSMDLTRWQDHLRNRCDPSLIVQQTQSPNESHMKVRMFDLMVEIHNICGIDRDLASQLMLKVTRQQNRRSRLFSDASAPITHQLEAVTDPSVARMRKEVITLGKLIPKFRLGSEMGPPLKRTKYQ